MHDLKLPQDLFPDGGLGVYQDELQERSRPGRARGREVSFDKTIRANTAGQGELTFLAMYSPVSLCKTLFTVPPFPAPRSPTTLRSSSLNSGNPCPESVVPLLFSDFFLVFFTPLDDLLSFPLLEPLPSGCLLPDREEDELISMLANSRSISALLDMLCVLPGLGTSPSLVNPFPGASGAGRVDLIPNPAGFFLDTLLTLGGINVCPDDPASSSSLFPSSSASARPNGLGVA